MRHYPATRFHPALSGITQSRVRQPRRLGALAATFFYAAGFFTGAILFGELLLTIHR